MLTATDANLLRSKLDKAVLNIGKTNGTKLPAPKSNTEGVALQYWLWSHVAKQVEALRKSASREAIKVGVIFDHTKDPQDPGTEKLIYLSLIHISEPTRLLSISYAVFCLKKKK